MMKRCLLLAILSLSSVAYATETFDSSDFDISIFKSEKHKGYETIEIVVKGCVTHFDMKLEDMQKALDAKSNHTTNSQSEAFDEIGDKAILHYKEGCK